MPTSMKLMPDKAWPAAMQRGEVSPSSGASRHPPTVGRPSSIPKGEGSPQLSFDANQVLRSLVGFNPAHFGVGCKRSCQAIPHGLRTT